MAYYLSFQADDAGSIPATRSNSFYEIMFEFNLFNVAQFADQGLSLFGTLLLTSLSARTRMYGFLIFVLVNVPGIYLLVVTELWWILAVTPIWLYLNFRGLLNNYKESRAEN
tara:strand:- start:60 stop:395 length:336 start_codon:yes stop_codon:yes gene_type:complete